MGDLTICLNVTAAFLFLSGHEFKVLLKDSSIHDAREIKLFGMKQNEDFSRVENGNLRLSQIS